MRVSHYPLRPLSDAGKALLAVLVSVFATLLLLCWSPAHADDSSARSARSSESGNSAFAARITSASSVP